MSVSLEVIHAFLSRARSMMWAAVGEVSSVEPVVPGTKFYQLVEGDWCYTDQFAGYVRFSGIEFVSYRGEAVWSMSYYGGILPGSEDIVDEVHAFLGRMLLQHVSDTRLFSKWARGEAEGKWMYRYLLSELGPAHATELIYLRQAEGSMPVYHCHFLGGLIVAG